MVLLLGGVLLWYAGHLFKRVLPGVRASMGNAGRGLVAVLVGGGLVLMIIGYRGSTFEPVYLPPTWGWHLNNLLMIFAVILLGMGSSKGKLRAALRHPMLTGVLVWAIAHLLVNGDLASLVLFGGLGVWGVLEMIVINVADGPWERPESGPISGDTRLLVIGLVLYAIIVAVHSWLGVSPFPTSS
ncbi:MAG: NnrU family protein [Pseudomonadota bacterium]